MILDLNIPFERLAHLIYHKVSKIKNIKDILFGGMMIAYGLSLQYTKDYQYDKSIGCYLIGHLMYNILNKAKNENDNYQAIHHLYNGILIMVINQQYNDGEDLKKMYLIGSIIALSISQLSNVKNVINHRAYIVSIILYLISLLRYQQTFTNPY